jgi:hypothetical protein
MWRILYFVTPYDIDPSQYPPPPDCPAYWPAPDGNNYTDAPTPEMCQADPWRHGCPCDIDFSTCMLDEPGDGTRVVNIRCEEHRLGGFGYWHRAHFTPEDCARFVIPLCDTEPRCGKHVPWIPPPAE